VLSAEEQQRAPGRPGLSIQVAALRLDNDECLYSVHVDFKQWVALLVNPQATLETAIAVPAATWSPDYRFGIAPGQDASSDIVAAANQMIDEFIEAYRRANPSEKALP
jgi:hypothetical protein